VKEVATTRFTLEEVREYLGLLAARRGLPSAEVALAFSTLPVRVYDREAYESSLPEAIRRIGSRDPDDVDVLALAISLDLPLWTSDRDFRETGVETCTTAKLLAHLARG
jgi:predicted nucleic acid-binding protein